MRGKQADDPERLFALSQDLLGSADPSGHLRWVNAAWERTLGWSEDELFSRPYLEFIHPDDVETVAALAAKLEHMPPGESLEIEARARRRDGEYRWLRCSAAVAGGSEPMVYLSAKDVTDLHQALEQLARQTGELERSNAELERFAGVVSHDLRSSLSAVSGFLTLLEHRHGDELSQPARDLLTLTGEAGERMRLLVADLLAYARVGHSGREPEPVDVGRLAARVAASVAPAAELETTALPVVHALPREFEQLLANLIDNAAKFVAPGTRPRMRLSAEPIESAWQFELADNGIGVAADEAERIFGMFQRVDRGETYPGTGIGLAIALKVVEGAGGRIWVRPGASGGSVFAFTWPS